MATVRKLPSGRWKAQVYLGRDAEGKKLFRFLTRDTKREAILAAAEIEKDRPKAGDVSILQAIHHYIEVSDKTLSPSTIAGYKQTARIRYASIKSLTVGQLNAERARALINHWSAEGLSPKTIRNAYNLMMAAVRLYRPGLTFSISLPKARPADRYVPTDADIRALLSAAKGTSAEIPIMLAAFCSLRRGEIAALRTDDIVNGEIHVSRAIVRADDGSKVEKLPKTPAGHRVVIPPPELLELLQALPDGPVTSLSLNGIYKAFNAARDRAGLPPFSFHALRHYFASSLHAAGVPDKYIMQLGGWDDAATLTRIYQHTMSDKAEAVKKAASSYFSGIVKDS